MSTKRIERNAVVLSALSKASATTRNAVIASAKKDLVYALVDCAKAIIKRRVPLTRAQLNRILRLTADVRVLVSRGATLDERKRVLQKGGFISALLGPALKILAPALLGGLSSALAPRRRRR